MRLDSLVQFVHDYLGHIGCGSGTIRGLEHDLVVICHDVDARLGAHLGLYLVVYLGPYFGLGAVPCLGAALDKRCCLVLCCLGRCLGRCHECCLGKGSVSRNGSCEPVWGPSQPLGYGWGAVIVWVNGKDWNTIFVVWLVRRQPAQVLDGDTAACRSCCSRTTLVYCGNLPKSWAPNRCNFESILTRVDALMGRRARS